MKTFNFTNITRTVSCGKNIYQTTLKMESVRSSETFVSTYKSIRVTTQMKNTEKSETIDNDVGQTVEEQRQISQRIA
jgi:hypothetical protein